MLPWVALLAAEALMVGLVAIDPETDRDDVIEFAILAVFGGLGALVHGRIVGETVTFVVRGGAVTILGAIIGSGFRPAMLLWGSWWRKSLALVGAVVGATASFLFWA